MYPTQEEIMAEEQLHKPVVLLKTMQWKREIWKRARQGTLMDKFIAISRLIESIAEIYEKPVAIIFVPEAESCYYSPSTKTIAINQSCSIISALHELAHHLFGHSELKACKWSVWLFKKTFPRAFASLIWNRHMLVKPLSLQNANEKE